jgi:hypothetical protein
VDRGEASLLTTTRPPPAISRRPTKGVRAWLRAFTVEALAVIAGASLLMGVVVANRQPVVFADTDIYLWMGHMQVRPLHYALSPVIGGPRSAAEDPDAADETSADMRLRRTEMGARSAWFGLLLYAVTAIGSLWAYAALQSLAASYAVRTLWRTTVGGKALEHLGVMAALAALTTLPFFAGFAMPDLWAGVGLVALATLLFAREGLGRATQAALFVLVLCAMTFHQSNGIVAVLAVAMAAFAAHFVWRVGWRRMAPGLGLFVATLAAAFALQAGYGLAVRMATGDDLRSPPFLVARSLADGPGRTYLRASCARGVRWALCRFQDRPLDDSQEILWTGGHARGVFGEAGADERIRIDRQQLPFVLSAVAADPAGSLRAALTNTWRLLTDEKLEDPLRDPHFYLTDPQWSDTYIADLVHDINACDPDQRGCRPRFDPAPLEVWHGAACLAALAGLAYIAGRKRTRRQVFAARLGPTIVFLLGALVFNAAVLGILSGPFARYQARIAWLLPLAALLAARAAFSGPDRLVDGAALQRRQPHSPAPFQLST